MCGTNPSDDRTSVRRDGLFCLDGCSCKFRVFFKNLWPTFLLQIYAAVVNLFRSKKGRSAATIPRSSRCLPNVVRLANRRFAGRARDATTALLTLSLAHKSFAFVRRGHNQPPVYKPVGFVRRPSKSFAFVRKGFVIRT